MTCCPHCGSTETEINEIDDSTCCAQCGTVLESSFTSLDYIAAYSKDTDKSTYRTKKKSAKITSICDCYHLAAQFFGLDYSKIEQGKEKIEYYAKVLPRRRHMETALAMVCVMDERDWDLNNYILHFPHPVHRASCIKAYRVFTNNQAVTEVDTIDNVVESFYDVIKMTLFGSPTVPEELSLVNLKAVVKSLIDLGNLYRINFGKKARAIVAATCCIAALYLRTTISTLKKRKKSKKNKKKSEFKWSFEIFAKPFSCSTSCIKKAYLEYNRLLDACFKKLPWTSQQTEAYYQLDDILHLFGGEHIKLTADEFVPDIQLKRQEARDNLQQCVDVAMIHIQNLTVPDDRLVYSVYQLLLRGHDAAEIVQMQESAIQEMCVTLEFRELHNSALPHSHMDNKQLGAEDLSTKEESYYLL